MGNKNNLVPFTSNQSHEEAVKNGKKGGKKSGQVRRDKKLLRDCLEILLEEKITVDDRRMTGMEAFALSAFQKALCGDVKAMEFVRDSIGQKPVDKVMVAEVEQSVIDEVEEMVRSNDKE